MGAGTGMLRRNSMWSQCFLLLPGGFLPTTTVRSTTLVKGLLGSCEQFCLFMSLNPLKLRRRWVQGGEANSRFSSHLGGLGSSPSSGEESRRAGTWPQGLVLVVPWGEAMQLTYELLKHWPQSSPRWVSLQGSPGCKVWREMQIEPEQEPAGVFSRGPVLHQVRSCRCFPHDGLHMTFSTTHPSFSDELHGPVWEAAGEMEARLHVPCRAMLPDLWVLWPGEKLASK